MIISLYNILLVPSQSKAWKTTTCRIKTNNFIWEVFDLDISNQTTQMCSYSFTIGEGKIVDSGLKDYKKTNV